MVHFISRISLFFILVTNFVNIIHCHSPIIGDHHWWQEKSVIYQIYPRSFRDSDGDGIGDLKGIESKLDYLVELGVGGIWLSPIYKSPMADFGYDISDYMDIDPIFGTMEDFVSLVESAHSKGIKLIMDFVPNHSSDQHEWFKKSVNREDPFTNYYVWVDPKGFNETTNEPIPPSNWVSQFRCETPDCVNSAWTYRQERGQFYLHQYLKEQPDLNYREPAIIDEMMNVLKFWMDLGVDGFRQDTVSSLVEDDQYRDEPRSYNPLAVDENDWLYYRHIYTDNLPETKTVLGYFDDFIKSYDDRINMVEAYLPIDEQVKYYEVSDFPFNFKLIGMRPAHLRPLSAQTVLNQIHKWIDNTPKGKLSNWVLGNHDRSRVASEYGLHLIDALNLITLTLPGVKIIYQGEEIGMTNNMNITFEETQDPSGIRCGPEHYQECSRDPVRTPFQWSSDDPTAGFSSNSSAHTWLPVNDDYLEGVNVEEQMQNPSSHLSMFIEAMILRNDDSLGNLSPTDGKYFYAIISDNVLVFSSYRTMLVDQRVYITIVNFNMRRTTIDIDEQFYPLPSKGEILIESTPYKWFNSTPKSSNLKDHPWSFSNDVNLNHIELNPFQSLLLRVDPIENVKHA